MFTNKIFQEITVIFVTEVEQKYTVIHIFAIFSDTMEVTIFVYWHFMKSNQDKPQLTWKTRNGYECIHSARLCYGYCTDGLYPLQT